MPKFSCSDEELKARLIEYVRADNGRVPARFCRICGTRVMLDPNGLFGESDKALLCLNASDWSQAALTWFADSTLG